MLTACSLATGLVMTGVNVVPRSAHINMAVWRSTVEAAPPTGYEWGGTFDDAVGIVSPTKPVIADEPFSVSPQSLKGFTTEERAEAIAAARAAAFAARGSGLATDNAPDWYHDYEWPEGTYQATRISTLKAASAK